MPWATGPSTSAGYRAGSRGGAKRLPTAAAEEEADAAGHAALAEVDVRDKRRGGELLVGELELDARVIVQDARLEDGAPGGEDGRHLLCAHQGGAEARALISRGSERDAKQ